MKTIPFCSELNCWVLVLITAWNLNAKPSPQIPEGWSTGSPREEIRPEFSYRANGGVENGSRLLIEADAREGLAGYWMKAFPVEGGRYYAFAAFRKVHNISSARRSAVARLVWQDEKGKSVLTEEKVVQDVLQGFAP